MGQHSKKIKFENFQIGTVLYGVDEYNISKGVQEFKVTGIMTHLAPHKNSAEIIPIRQEVYFKYGRATTGIPYHMAYFGFSKVKAQRALDNLVRAQQRYDKRRQTSTDNYEANKVLIETEYAHLIGKQIMAKVGPNGEWEKTRIEMLHATYKKGVIQFSTEHWRRGRGNTYNINRAGKAWYFWSEELELKHKRILAREKYEKELARLNENYALKERQFEEELEVITDGANNKA